MHNWQKALQEQMKQAIIGEEEYKEAVEKLSLFTQKVYEAVRAIPKGYVKTYGQVAAEIGHPGAARAVGSACAKNPFLGCVPCHRVVRADGLLGAYSFGGTEMKSRLIDIEKEV